MNYQHRKSAGMTLIELLVVMVIVGILAAIAFPSYANYVMRTNRAAARACLSDAAQLMERFYTTNLTYVDADSGDGGLEMGCESDAGLDERYTFTVDNLAQRTYRLVATPIDAQAVRDTQCATLTLNQTGARTPTTAGCW